MAKLFKSRRLEAGYTIVNNAVFFDYSLSLRSIGLLVKMLSLPDDWKFSINGLSKICADGPTSVRVSLNDLEEHGYLVRARERKENGQMGGAVYMVFDEPVDFEEACEELESKCCQIITARANRSAQCESKASRASHDRKQQVDEEPDADPYDFTGVSGADADEENARDAEAGKPQAGKAQSGAGETIKYLGNKGLRGYDTHTVARARDAGARAAGPFEPPTFEEVTGAIPGVEEMLGREFGDRDVLARKFLSYNEARGWTVGGEPVRSWKALLTKFLIGEAEAPTRRSGSPRASESRPLDPYGREGFGATQAGPEWLTEGFSTIDDAILCGQLGPEARGLYR